jgi:lysyl-tRNA synthetase class 2
MSADSVIQRMHARARMVEAIRAFFNRAGYLEVDTPLLHTATNTDVHIQSIGARVNGLNRYLQTSPEFAMKRLLAAGSGSIFQICHAFRDEEQGRVHRSEFSLLEWYSVGMDYRALMQQLSELVSALMPTRPAFRWVSYQECFQQSLAIDPLLASDAAIRRSVDIHVPGLVARELDRDACLDLLMSQVVAARFSGFTLVFDYPASQASLARIKADNPAVAERFELFYDDLELANGFSELTDAAEQRIRFENDNQLRRQRGLPVYPLDEDFLRALDAGLPECAGVAVGLDRLLMVLQGKNSLDEVLPFVEF